MAEFSELYNDADITILFISSGNINNYGPIQQVDIDLGETMRKILPDLEVFMRIKQAPKAIYTKKAIGKKMKTILKQDKKNGIYINTI